VGLYAYPVFCDPDNDGDIDIVCGRDGMGFYYYQNQGNAETPNWQRNDAVMSGPGNDYYFNSPVIADINGDGKPDLIYGNASGPLQYYRNSGTDSSPSWTKDNSLFGGILDVGGASSPFFYDLDGDGDMDLILGNYEGTFSYYENQHEVLEVAENDFLPGQYTLSAYPNPFNPQTSLHMDLPKDAHVQLSLYDVNGRYLRSLMNAYQSAGEHTLRFRATNDMSSGVYIIRMSVNGTLAAGHKLLLLK
jgi:hypothetical protein